MIDEMTKQPMRVIRVEDWRNPGLFKPILTDVAVSQLDEVKRVLDRHGFEYWVNSYFSWNGGPETTYVIFSWATDPAAVQAALDEAD